MKCIKTKYLIIILWYRESSINLYKRAYAKGEILCQENQLLQETGK